MTNRIAVRLELRRVKDQRRWVGLWVSVESTKPLYRSKAMVTRHEAEDLALAYYKRFERYWINKTKWVAVLDQFRGYK